MTLTMLLHLHLTLLILGEPSVEVKPLMTVRLVQAAQSAIPRLGFLHLGSLVGYQLSS